MNLDLPFVGLGSLFAAKFNRYILLLQVLDSNELLIAISQFLEVPEIIALASSSKRYLSILKIQSIQLRILRAKVAWMEGTNNKPYFSIDLMTSISFDRKSPDADLKGVSTQHFAHSYEDFIKFNEKMRLSKKLKNEGQTKSNSDPARNLMIVSKSQSNSINLQTGTDTVQLTPRIDLPIVDPSKVDPPKVQKPKKKLKYHPQYIKTLMEAEAQQDYYKRLQNQITKAQAKQSLEQREIMEEERLRKLRKLAERDDRYKQMLQEEEIKESELEMRRKKRIEKLTMRKSPKPEEVMKKLAIPQVQEENKIVSTQWIDKKMNQSKLKAPVIGLKPGETLVVYKESIISKIATYFGVFL